MGELREVLEEGSTAERKAFIKTFVKDILITGGDAVMKYTLPQMAKGEPRSGGEVLSIVPWWSCGDSNPVPLQCH